MNQTKHPPVKGHEGSKGKMFENPILEFLSKSSPTTTIITYGTLITTLIVLNYYYGLISNIWEGIGIYLGGFFFWTFAEYFLHRYLFHWITEHPFVQKFHYSVHGYHHEFPRDDTRVFMPPVPGIVLSSIFLGLFYLIMGAYAFIFTAGYINGYLVYSSVHYSTHKFKPPKSRWLKVLWRHHNLHHYRFPNKAFGVSSPLWDYVFGTMPPLPKKRTQGSQA